MDIPGTARRLKLIRGEKSQDEFAQLIGIHKNTLGKYERGTTDPDLGLVRRICEIFSVNLQWFYLGQGPMYAGSGNHHTPPDVKIQTKTPALDALDALMKENSELRQENRELRLENRTLLKENGDLRVALARLEPRGDPSEGLIDGQAGEAARKSA